MILLERSVRVVEASGALGGARSRGKLEYRVRVSSNLNMIAERRYSGFGL